MTAALSPVAAAMDLQLQAALASGADFVPPGTDFSPLLVRGGRITLIPDAQYPPIAGGTTISVPNTSLCGFNNALTFGPGPGSSGVRVAAANVTIGGIKASGLGNTVAFNLVAGGTGFCLRDSSFSALEQLLKIDAGADGATVSRVSMTDATGGDVIFCSADYLSVFGLTAPGSVGEHIIRLDKGTGGHRPQHTLIANSVLTNHNSPRKEVLAFREADFVAVINSLIDGWIDLGQDNGDPTDVSTHCTGVRLVGLAFTQGARPGGQVIQARHDVDLLLADVFAFGFADVPAVTVDIRSVATLIGCVQRVPAGVIAKDFAKGAGTVIGSARKVAA